MPEFQPFENVLIQGAMIGVVKTPDGGKMLTITTPVRQYSVPLTEEVASDVGAQLISAGLQVARQMPKGKQ